MFGYLLELKIHPFPIEPHPYYPTLHVDIIDHFLVSDYIRIVQGFAKDEVL